MPLMIDITNNELIIVLITIIVVIISIVLIRKPKPSPPVKSKIIGILGGMGPVASSAFMMRLTELTAIYKLKLRKAVNDGNNSNNDKNNNDDLMDKDYFQTLLWSNPRTLPHILKLDENNIPEDTPYLPLQQGVDKLTSGGCGLIVIPCNTVHYWYDRLQERANKSGVKIINIIDAAHEKLKSNLILNGKIGLLSTRVTIRTNIYNKRLPNYEIIVSTEEERAIVTKGIFLVKETKELEAFALFADAFNALVERGAKIVILGCTEIPVGIKAGINAGHGIKLRVPFIDCNDALAEETVRYAVENDY